MRWSGIEPEFKRWQRLVIAATLPAQSESFAGILLIFQSILIVFLISLTTWISLLVLVTFNRTSDD